MSLKQDVLFSRLFFAAILLSGVTLSAISAWAQVPSNTANNIALATANEVAGSAGTIESLHSFANGGVVVKTAATNLIPFGADVKALLDMKGFDGEFTRSFTFTNTGAEAVTISDVQFANKSSRFDFVSIGGDASLPLDVPAGETFTIRVKFHSSERNTVNSDKLLFMTEQYKEPIAYQIQAVQKALSDMPWNKKTASK
jgi:hypothetical protein